MQHIFTPQYLNFAGVTVMYRLLCCGKHFGADASGHYVCYASNPNEYYYELNDETVRDPCEDL